MYDSLDAVAEDLKDFAKAADALQSVVDMFDPARLD
jgi:hypothetical protein